MKSDTAVPELGNEAGNFSFMSFRAGVSSDYEISLSSPLKDVTAVHTIARDSLQQIRIYTHPFSPLQHKVQSRIIAGILMSQPISPVD